MTGPLPGGHAVVLPIVLPLAAGALLVLVERWRPHWQAPLSLAATLAAAVLAMVLLVQAGDGRVQVYLAGNWQAPYGIALALDRVAALMLVLTAAVAVPALLFALSDTAARGPGFHALFQFQLMGLNGAFLTADLFNLFVFFEVLLGASYGLLLHGGGRARLKAGLHYVVFNLAGSALFLLALSLLYALAGTLNMADLAVKLAALPAPDHALAQTAALLLLTVFAVKAALLPLYFWLPDAYAAASAPVAALFAIMTKVGVYAIARVTTLVFGAGALADVAAPALPALALATLVLAAMGALAAPRLRTLVAYLVVGSAGTLLLALGLGSAQTLAAGLFYLVPSTLVAAAWFLLAEHVTAARGGHDTLTPAAPAGPLLGVAFFIAAVAVAGVPPLAGFLGKAWLLQAAGQTDWALPAVAVVLGSSLALMAALARAGATLFWAGGPAAAVPAAARPAPQRAAIGALLAAVLACAAAAGPLAAYCEAAALQMHAPQAYIAAVLGARPVPPRHDVRQEMRARGEGP
jgi:multicomponent K+:H+ antiporter subunit D